jgi:flagellar FliL protein
MQKILILINLVVALACAGVVFYSHNMIKPAPTDQKAETEAIKTDAMNEMQLQPVPIKKFIVNLESRPSRLRYLDLEMNILTFHEEEKELIKSNEHIFKDIVIEIASHLAPEDLDTMTGKILLENKIKKKVNAKLITLNSGQPVVKQIFFSGFVVQ